MGVLRTMFRRSAKSRGGACDHVMAEDGRSVEEPRLWDVFDDMASPGYVYVKGRCTKCGARMSVVSPK